MVVAVAARMSCPSRPGAEEEAGSALDVAVVVTRVQRCSCRGRRGHRGRGCGRGGGRRIVSHMDEQKESRADLT